MPSPPSSLKLRHNWQFTAIGTAWAVETRQPLPPHLQNAITRRIATFDRTYSRFRDDSLVWRMGQKAGKYVFPPDAAPLMQFYQQLYTVTSGAVSPLVGDILAAMGYNRQYSFVPGAIGSVPVWGEVMQWNGATVTTQKPITLDVGAAGKGYLVDIIGGMLEANGVAEYVIDASGDIRHRGKDTQTIGLENPFDATRVIGVMNVNNASLCASATNRRRWGNGLHHIVNPHTKQPVTAIAATWVHASTTLIADGLATALFFSDATLLQQTWDFEYVVMANNGKITHSHNFMGELFI